MSRQALDTGLDGYYRSHYNSAVPTKSPPTSVRLSAEGRGLLRRLSRALGVSQASVMELALRTLARREGVKSESDRSGG